MLSNEQIVSITHKCNKFIIFSHMLTHKNINKCVSIEFKILIILKHINIIIRMTTVYSVQYIIT